MPDEMTAPDPADAAGGSYLLAVEFTDTTPGGYWEDQGYPWFGGL